MGCFGREKVIKGRLRLGAGVGSSACGFAQSLADLTPDLLSLNEVEGADFEGRVWQNGVFGPGNGDTLLCISTG